MDEHEFGAADCPPRPNVLQTGGDRATDELMKIPASDIPGLTLPEEIALQATHAHLALVARLAGSEH